MKPYEEIAFYKNQLGWLGNKRNGRFNNVQNLKRDLARVQEEHRLIEKSYIDSIEHEQADLDALEILLDDLKEKYKAALGREIKKPPKKPAIKDDLVRDEEGKIECTICHEFFSPQGIKSHEIACKRRELQKQIDMLG